MVKGKIVRFADENMAAAGIILAAALLRFYHLGVQSLWSDEGNSAAMAARPLARIALDTSHDIHPPFYYWLLHFWSAAFGQSEIALRSLSALAGIVLVWLAYLLGKRLYGRRVGLLAATLTALSPLAVYYSQEARMYALLAAITAAAVWFALGSGWTNAALTGVFVAAGLYTHYTFPIVWIPIALVLLAKASEKHEKVVEWFGAHLLALILFLPWLQTAWRQVTTWPRSQAHVSLLHALPSAWGWLVMGPMANLVQSPWVWALLALAAASGMVRESNVSWGRTLVVVWLVVPLVIILVPGLYKPAYLKFLVVAVLPWALSTAAGVDVILRRGKAGVALSAAGIVLVGALLVMGDAAYFGNPRYARDNYRGIVRYITAVAGPRDAVILDAPGQIEVFRYYYHGTTPIYPLPEQRPPDKAATEARLAQIAADSNRLFVLYWATEESDPAGIVEGWLGQHTFKAADSWQGNVRFAIYSVPHADLPVEPTGNLFGDQIALAEAGMAPRALQAGDVLQILLRWQALKKPVARYKVTVQVLDDRQQVVAQQDGEPAGGSMHTDKWSAGQVVDDLHGVLIPFGVPPGNYRVGVAVYRADTGRRLAVPSGQGNMIFIGRVQITRPSFPLPVDLLPIRHRKSIRADGVRLLGFDFYKRGYSHAPDTPIHAGDLLHVELYWQACGDTRENMRFRLSLVDGHDKAVAVTEGKIGGDGFPTSCWKPGDIVKGEHDLALPAGLRPGVYRLRLEFDRARPVWPGRVRVR